MAGSTGGTTSPLSCAPLPVARLELCPAVLSPVLASAWLWLASVEDARASAPGPTAWPQRRCRASVCRPSAFLHTGACRHHLILGALVLRECTLGHLADETEFPPLKLP